MELTTPLVPNLSRRGSRHQPPAACVKCLRLFIYLRLYITRIAKKSVEDLWRNLGTCFGSLRIPEDRKDPSKMVEDPQRVTRNSNRLLQIWRIVFFSFFFFFEGNTRQSSTILKELFENENENPEESQRILEIKRHLSISHESTPRCQRRIPPSIDLNQLESQSNVT